MNLGDLKRQVYAPLRDDGRAFVLDGEVEDWLNTAQLDLAIRTRLIEGTQLSTDTGKAIVAGGKIPLPSDFIDYRTLRLGTDDVLFCSDDVWDSWSDDLAVPDRTLGRVFGAFIELYPNPAITAAYTLRYVAAPVLLNTPEDTPELPATLHFKLVRFARAEALRKMREFDASREELALYEQGLPSPPTGRERLHPGPIQLTLAPGVFDEDWYVQ